MLQLPPAALTNVVALAALLLDYGCSSAAGPEPSVLGAPFPSPALGNNEATWPIC